MTPEQAKIVRETWRRVVPVADAAAALFYERLFEIDPTTRPLFAGVDLAAQRKKLVHVLGTAVAGLDRLDALMPALEELGRRHREYGVVGSHYDSVGAALLWALERGLAPAWTAEARTAWTQAYALLSGVMRRAAREAAPARRSEEQAAE
jgi:hemoglobin-like flavoprotein